MFYLENESDIRKQYCVLRKRILAWLEVCNTEPENWLKLSLKNNISDCY